MYIINLDKDEKGLRRAAGRYTDNTYNTICRHGNKIDCSDSYDMTQKNPSNYLPRALILFYLHVLFNSNCCLNVRARSAMSGRRVGYFVLDKFVSSKFSRLSIFEQLLGFEYLVMFWLLLLIQSCYCMSRIRLIDKSNHCQRSVC